MQEKRLKDLLKKFEEMLALGETLYLDADDYDSVIEYYDREDQIDKAKYILSIGLDIHPDSESLILRKIRFMIYDKRYLDAIHFLDHNFISYDFDAYLLKIECYLSLHLSAEASILTQTVLSDGEIDKDVLLSELGYVYLETEYLKEALVFLEESLNYNSENEEVLTEIIFISEYQDNYSKAIEYCDKLLDIDPYNGDGWLLLGKFYSLLGEYDKAIDAFEFYSTIKEDDLSSMRLKAHCLILIGRTEEAVDLLLQCIDIDPKEEILYVSLIDCYTDLERYDDILKVVELYEIGQETTSAYLLSKKAYAYSKLENYDKAVFYIKEALSNISDSLEINLVAVDVYFQLRQYDSVIELCDIILLDNPGNLAILEKAVIAAVSLYNYNKAIDYQKKILGLDKSKENQQKLILLYLENGDEKNYIKSIESSSDETLFSIYSLFYTQKSLDQPQLSRDYMLLQLQEIFNSKVYNKK